MMWCLLLQIVSNKCEQKHRVPDTHKQWLCKCCKVDEDYIEFDTQQAENIKRAETQKMVFQKNW